MCLACTSSSILSFNVRHSLVVWPKLWWYRQCLLWLMLGGIWVLFGANIRSTFSASSKIIDRYATNEVYWAKRMGRRYSLCRLGALSISFLTIWPGLPSMSCTFVRNSHNSWSCMNFAALCHNLSMFTAGFLQRLLDKGPGFKGVTRWCIATSELRFWILSLIFSNCSVNVCRDSIFSSRMFTSIIDVKW